MSNADIVRNTQNGIITVTPRSNAAVRLPSLEVNLKEESAATRRGSEIASALERFANGSELSANRFLPQIRSQGDQRTRLIVEFVDDRGLAATVVLNARDDRVRANRDASVSGIVPGQRFTEGGTGVLTINISRFIRDDATLDEGGLIAALSAGIAQADGHIPSFQQKGRNGLRITEQDFRDDAFTLESARNLLVYDADVLIGNQKVRKGSAGYPADAQAIINAQVNAGAPEAIDAFFRKHKDAAGSFEEFVAGFSVDADTLSIKLGTELGKYLVGEGTPLATLAQGALATITQNVGQAIVAGGFNKPLKTVTGKVNTVLADFGQELVTNLASAGTGAVSSMLALELGRAVGVRGFGGELLSTATTKIIDQVATNAINIARFQTVAPGSIPTSAPDAKNLFHELKNGGLFKSVGKNDWAGGVTSKAMSSFLGRKLGSLIISPSTKEGKMFASIGSTAGSLKGTSITLGIGKKIGLAKAKATKLTKVGSLIAPGIGSLIGFVAGALLGKLFFGRPPKPWAAAETSLNLTSGFWDLGAVTARHGGNKDIASSMAVSARDTINGVIAQVAGREDVAGNANLTQERHRYRYEGSSGSPTPQTYFMHEMVGTQWQERYRGRDASAAVDMGVLLGLRDTRIAGGDIYLKRAIHHYLPAGAMPAAGQDIVTLLGNLQIAEDFGRYMRDPEVINRLIAANPNSPFTAGWAITLLRAEELNLNRFSPSDFHGGVRGFLDSFDLAGAGLAYENFSWYGHNGTTIGQLGGSRGVFAIMPPRADQTTNDVVIGQTGAFSNGRTLTIDIAQAGITRSGVATAGNDWHAVAPSTSFDGGQGDDILMGLWGDEAIFGGPGYDWIDGQTGNDFLVGGDQDDVLLGNEGLDRLEGGTGNDYLALGDGDDHAALGGGNAGAWGSAGNDTLVGGRGVDVMYGEDGDDTFIWENDSAWDDHLGGAGSNTISFERLTAGVSGDMRPRGMFSWAPEAWSAFGDFVHGVENVTLTSHADVMHGSDFANVLRGLAGNDLIHGHGGNDTLEGGAGADILWGGLGVDTASYANSASGVSVSLRTTDTNFDPAYYRATNPDLAHMTDAQALWHWTNWGWVERRNPNAAFDTNYYLMVNTDVAAAGSNPFDHYRNWGADEGRRPAATLVPNTSAFGGDASGDQLYGFENLTGSRFADVLEGDEFDNELRGLGGDDVLIATRGADRLVGGDGFDVIDFSNATLGVGFSTPSAWSVSGWGSGTHDGSIEGLIGSAHGDYLLAGAGDHELDGGGADDILNAGDGSDTYVWNRGGGHDTVHDTNSQRNGLLFGEGIAWRDIYITGPGGPNNGNLIVKLRDSTGGFTVSANMRYDSNPTRHNHVIKTIDMGGAGAIEVGAVDWIGTVAGNPLQSPWDGDDIAVGAQNRADVIFAYAGNDTVYAAGSAGAHEDRDNVIYAGDGNDTVHASVGDDQYIFERGNGHDLVFDTGGVDTIVLGPSVSAEDVVIGIGNVTSSGADLFISIRNPADPNGPASESIRVVGGGFVVEGYYTPHWNRPLNTIEYIKVGGQTLRTTDLFTPHIVYDYRGVPAGGGGGGGGGGGQLPPVALDLDGDGAELRSAHGSRMSAVDADGTLYRIGWVGQDDGILTLDRNGDGVIDRVSEISFVQDKEGARTDLEGLAGHDSDGDGELTAKDARWKEFRVWRDLNQDGVSADGELMTLEEAGIEGLSLKGETTWRDPSQSIDTTVVATAAVRWTDPERQGRAHDVILRGWYVRADEARAEIAPAERLKGDAIESRLWGVQELTEEQAKALEARRASGRGGSDLLLGRVETFLEDKGTTAAEGLWVATNVEAVAEANRQAARAAARGGTDRFARDPWTLEGSQDARVAAQREALLANTEVSARLVERTATAEESAAADAAVRHWEAFDAEVAADQAARDARAAVDPASLVRPDPSQTFESAWRMLPPEERAEPDPAAPTPVTPVGVASRPQSISPQQQMLRQDQIEQVSAMREPQRAATDMPAPAAIEVNGPAAVNPSAAPTPTLARASRANDDEPAYWADIEAANLRLVSAMARFSAQPGMMTLRTFGTESYLRESWISAGALPSVERLAAVA